MRKSWKAATVAAIVAALAACDETGFAPVNGLDGEDAAQLALATDLVTGSLLSDQIGAAGGAEASFAEAAAPGRTREFHRERRCPAGGGITIDGTIEKVDHGEGVVEFFIAGDGRQIDCAFQRRRFTLTLNGEFVLTAYRKRVNGEPVGPQTTTKVGWFDWVRTNAAGEVIGSGHCEYEITSVRNPDSGKREVTGHVCGRDVSRSVDWDRRG